MSIFDLFHKKNNIESRLFFKFCNSNIVHSNNISKEVHTKKKYYYETFCDHLLRNNGTLVRDLSISNIAIYVATSYIGTKVEELTDVIYQRGHDFESGRYPLFYVDEGTFAIYLSDVVKHCTDIHAELDHKDGKCMAKYIFHCVDNENNFDIYLTLYSDSLSWDAKNLLLNPDWIV